MDRREERLKHAHTLTPTLIAIASSSSFCLVWLRFTLLAFVFAVLSLFHVECDANNNKMRTCDTERTRSERERTQLRVRRRYHALERYRRFFHDSPLISTSFSALALRCLIIKVDSNCVTILPQNTITEGSFNAKRMEMRIT